MTIALLVLGFRFLRVVVRLLRRVLVPCFRGFPHVFLEFDTSPVTRRRSGRGPQFQFIPSRLLVNRESALGTLAVGCTEGGAGGSGSAVPVVSVGLLAHTRAVRNMH